MNKLYSFKRRLFPFAILFIAALGAPHLLAEPYISIKTNQPCSACHVNPIGGGMRTTFGNIYGHQQMPETAAENNNFEFAKINEFISLGGDARYDLTVSEDDTPNSEESSFDIRGAQIYLLINAGRSDMSLYLDQRVAPGSTINREAFLIKRFDNNHYLKVGRYMLPFGLRIEDDSAFTRQVTGINFDNSDNGIEYGIQKSNAIYNFFAANGTGNVSNNDDKFLVGARGEWFINSLRLGAAAILNNEELGDKTLFSLFGGYQYGMVTLLGEVNIIDDDNNALNNGDVPQERIGLVELNFDISQGHNLKFTSELYDPRDDLDEDHETRQSLVYEYTPISNLQTRFGIRSRDAIPQNPQNQRDTFFAQLHFYF